MHQITMNVQNQWELYCKLNDEYSFLSSLFASTDVCDLAPKFHTDDVDLCGIWSTSGDSLTK